jgi:transposase
MGYHRMTAELLGAIWTRLREGKSRRSIAEALGLDKKTVNSYADKIEQARIPLGSSLAQTLPILVGLLGDNRKPQPAVEIFEPLRDDIRRLIQGDKETYRQPMKAKTAWLVLKDLYSLGPRTSYESFKRFCRREGLSTPAGKPVARIETEPGEEVQLDYAHMGPWMVHERRRTVYAYLGILSHSRLPYLEFCTSQDETSFAGSTQRLFHFFGGAVRRVNPDNLKAGVLSADIYDPVLNRCFAELCDHYGVIVDPARPATPTDKGKIERFVQVAREVWRRFTALHPQASLDELNALVRDWCLNEYGKAIHGTTGLAPLDVFERVEKPALRPLPETLFEVAKWTIASVGRDQFATVEKVRYGLPAVYIGKRLSVRITTTTVEFFHEYRSIRAYVKNKRLEQFLPADFPAHAQPFEPDAFAKALRAQAARVSPQAARYIEFILSDGTNLARRRATACLGLIEKSASLPGLSHALAIALAEGVCIPLRLETILGDEELQRLLPFPPSERGARMARPADYYAKP